MTEYVVTYHGKPYRGPYPTMTEAEIVRYLLNVEHPEALDVKPVLVPAQSPEVS